MAEYSLRPWDRQIEMQAELNWMFANANRDHKKHPQPFKLAEFMPGRAETNGQGQTAEEMNAVLANMAKQTGVGRRV